MNNINPNSEELLYNLPDYIAGSITDKELIDKIRNEININPEFKAEYELLSETFAEVNNLKFSEPPEHYFTNLVPNINEKILKQKESKGIARFFKLSNLVKYALPAVSVILLIFIVTYSNKNGKEENLFNQFGDTINEIMKNKSDSSEESFDSDKDAAMEIDAEDELTDSDESSDLQDIENGNIIEIYDENGDTDEDFFYYTDFETLSKIEQNEIINTLSETKF